MKKALIIGVTGNFGGQMTRSLIKNDWEVKVLMRDPAKAPDWLRPSQILVGTAQDEKAVEKAAEGVTLIVYAANPAYHKWHQDAMKMLEPTVRVAEKLGLRILFPGNVYNFAPGPEAKKETDPMQPLTDKGEIRIQMEDRLKQASQNGAKVTIIRAGDFLGPEMQLSWFKMIIKKKREYYTYAMPHNPQHIHFWSYLPDLCDNAVRLVEAPESNFDVWHDKGLPLTVDNWRNAFASLGMQLKTRKFPWWIFKIASIASPLLREVMKMRYLWQSNVIMDGTKLQKKLDSHLSSTPLPEIVRNLVGKTF